MAAAEGSRFRVKLPPAYQRRERISAFLASNSALVMIFFSCSAARRSILEKISSSERAGAVGEGWGAVCASSACTGEIWRKAARSISPCWLVNLIDWLPPCACATPVMRWTPVS